MANTDHLIVWLDCLDFLLEFSLDNISRPYRIRYRIKKPISVYNENLLRSKRDSLRFQEKS